MYNQEDEIDLFFREQEGSSEKKEPEQRPDDGLPSIMRALDERPKDDFQPAVFPTGGFKPAPIEEDTYPKEDDFFEESPVELGGFHNSATASYDRHKEMQEQLEREERNNRCTALSKKYMQLFMILIGGVALNFISTVLANIASGSITFHKAAGILMIVVAASSLGISVLYGLFLLRLERYRFEFKLAGVYYIVAGACEAVSKATSGGLSLILTILGAVFSVLYVLKFAVGMSNSFDNIASYMAITWETFKKVYKYVFSGIVICSILSFLPVFGLIAVIGLLILSIASIVVSIWQIILVFRSARVMKQYSTAIHV